MTADRRVALGALLVALVAALSCGYPGGGGADQPAPPSIDRERPMMGTYFRIQAARGAGEAEVDLEQAVDAALAELERVEALLSEWRETSEISAVNREAGVGPVVVGPELFEVVARSLELREQTGGAFDVTFAGCGRLWSFREPRVPDETEIARCLERVGREIVLDQERSTIFLPDPETRIGIAAIGKGYGVDRAAAVLESRGVQNYIVDGGGDIRLAGRKGDRPWTVGIAHPRSPGRLYGALDLDRGAVVTSGDYQKYFTLDGVRYHHILDPRTARPARRSVAVTVIAPDATRADALATGLFVMGPEAGLALVESLPEVEALFFDPDLGLHRSSGFPGLS